LLILGFLIALFMNLDTIQIARDSLNDKQQLGKTVDNIVSQMPGIKSGDGQIAIQKNDGSVMIISMASKTDTSKKTQAINERIKTAHDLGVYLQTNSGISLGYKSWDDFTDKWKFSGGREGDFFIALFGIILTTFALQLSSSFWFDLMNKAVNIRAAGKKPDSGKKT